MKRYLYLLTPFLLFLPQIALAQEEEVKSAFHVFYERSFGPIGAIAGIIAMVAFWQMAAKAEKNFAFTLKMFVLVLLFVNIGSISFGIHGSGLLDGETSRYIERVCRLIALLTADIGALVLFLRLNKKEEVGNANAKTDEQI